MLFFWRESKQANDYNVELWCEQFTQKLWLHDVVFKFFMLEIGETNIHNNQRSTAIFQSSIKHSNENWYKFIPCLIQALRATFVVSDGEEKILLLMGGNKFCIFSCSVLARMKYFTHIDRMKSIQSFARKSVECENWEMASNSSSHFQCTFTLNKLRSFIYARLRICLRKTIDNRFVKWLTWIE